jgi:hypothetical protein
VSPRKLTTSRERPSGRSWARSGQPLLDNAPISESNRAKLAHKNALQAVPPTHSIGRCLLETQRGIARAA